MSLRCMNCFMEYNETDEACPHCGHIRGAPAAEKIYLNPGTLLNGRYSVGQVVGSGGFGIIYKAWDNQTGTIVAIKEFFQSGIVSRATDTQYIVLVANNRADEFYEGKQRFFDEAVNMQRFTGHPNIVTVLDLFEGNGTCYMVMEFLSGDTLGEYAEKVKLTLEEKINFTLRVGNALNTLHNAGILHRDVSPDNIIIPYDYPGEDVKLFDFGAARFSRYEKETMQTRIMKPGYSPPEQYGPGSGQNEQIDVYALGATLYHLLTGIKPEESTNRRVEDLLPSPKALDNEIPENVSNAVMTAMALDPHLRFKSVHEFQTAMTQREKVLTPKGRMDILKRRRRRIILCAAVVIAAGLSVFGTLFSREYNRTHLPDSAISLLYPISGVDAADAAKLNSLASVIEDFNAIYPNVRVELRGIALENYADEVSSYMRRGDYPAVFESTMLDPDTLGQALDVSGVIGGAERNECCFLDNYSRFFPDKRQIPAGFSVPAVYINPQLCSYESYGVSDISALLADMPFSVSEKGLSCNESYISVYRSLFSNSISLADRASFIDGETGAYFSDTAEYYALLKDMPGRIKALYIDNDAVAVEFGSLWSIMPGNSAAQTAAKRFLQFMLNEKAQYELHIGNQSGLLPINKQSLDVYREVYVDFSKFFDDFFGGDLQ